MITTRRIFHGALTTLLAITPTIASAQTKDEGPLGNEEVAYILFASGGLLMAGGIATAIAGGVASSAHSDNLALAGFVSGGASMFVAGAAPVAVGLVLYPWDDGVAQRPAPSLGGSFTLSF